MPEGAVRTLPVSIKNSSHGHPPDVSDHRFPDGTMKGDYQEGHQGQNPIFGTETNFFRDQINHYYGHLSAEYKFSDEISLLYRAGLDTYADFRKSGAEGPRNIENENLYLANGSGFASETQIKNQRWNRSEEHTSELQSRGHLVCRLLLEKKKS